jgi:hypothetical protein
MKRYALPWPVFIIAMLLWTGWWLAHLPARRLGIDTSKTIEQAQPITTTRRVDAEKPIAQPSTPQPRENAPLYSFRRSYAPLPLDFSSNFDDWRTRAAAGDRVAILALAKALADCYPMRFELKNPERKSTAENPFDKFHLQRMETCRPTLGFTSAQVLDAMRDAANTGDVQAQLDFARNGLGFLMTSGLWLRDPNRGQQWQQQSFQQLTALAARGQSDAIRMLADREASQTDSPASPNVVHVSTLRAVAASIDLAQPGGFVGYRANEWEEAKKHLSDEDIAAVQLAGRQMLQDCCSNAVPFVGDRPPAITPIRTVIECTQCALFNGGGLANTITFLEIYQERNKPKPGTRFSLCNATQCQDVDFYSPIWRMGYVSSRKR